MAEDASDGGVSMASLGGREVDGALGWRRGWGLAAGEGEVLRRKSCARHAQVTPSKDRRRPPVRPCLARFCM